MPDLPDFSWFHDAFRDSAESTTAEGHIRDAYYMAYDAGSCEYVKLASPEIDKRLDSGPEMVSANFVIPYPPGFPIMVPGQVVTRETITFMRKLDVKEIHGFVASLGLKLLKARRARATPGTRRQGGGSAQGSGRQSQGRLPVTRSQRGDQVWASLTAAA